MEIPTTPDDPLSALPDLVLLRSIGERRPEALRELFRRHAPTLLALGKRILHVSEDAEEVLQEVFLQIWRGSDRYDPGRSSVATWLVLIMRSRAIDRLRNRQVVDRAHDAASLDAGNVHTSPEGAENVLLQQRRERVRAELSELPREQREVLEMAFYEGLTQSEICERTGIPLGTVKTRTLLAMKKLRKSLREDIRELL
ncbi:MAG TPA: sigma-70 family RNA polymerase sigma factor [Thermoanaerobaculia bacterium]|nr:sigma-70 family RNA polymerase sigma factor [Thermoanaerobaculia bacterium]